MKSPIARRCSKHPNRVTANGESESGFWYQPCPDCNAGAEVPDFPFRARWDSAYIVEPDGSRTVRRLLALLALAALLCGCSISPPPVMPPGFGTAPTTCPDPAMPGQGMTCARRTSP